MFGGYIRCTSTARGGLGFCGGRWSLGGSLVGWIFWCSRVGVVVYKGGYSALIDLGWGIGVICDY